MKTDDDDLTWPSDMRYFAEQWLVEMRSKLPEHDRVFSGKVVTMNFLGTPETQWTFLVAAVELAESQEELGAIAAGPFEHLLGFHGDAFIDAVEELCRESPKFARMTNGAWRHMMSDAVWERVQAIQASVSDTPQSPC